MDDNATATVTVTKHRLVHILSGNGHLLALVHVGNGALAYCFRYRFLDVLAVAAQETLTIDGAAIAAIQTSIDQMGHAALLDL